MSSMVNMIGWSVVLLLAQIVAQTLSLSKDCGLPYALSPRDVANPATTDVTKRLTRALMNLLETYPAFIALALALIATNKATGMGLTGAVIWFWARVVYVPVYAAGIPMLRTGVWTVSVIGLLMMLMALWS
ncbi:MAG: MAPEG family protein [Beijerinckiaceae bacterium]